jgi:hypothetical protein
MPEFVVVGPLPFKGGVASETVLDRRIFIRLVAIG